MTARPDPIVHFCIVQPPRYPHSMALLDPALHFRHQFRSLGAQVSMAKNRLRHDVPNLVFGAHLGFDASLLQEYACVLVNLEQLGQGGSAWSPCYVDLLRATPVIDYHPGNLAAYGRAGDEVPIVRFGFAPYLAKDEAEVLPIDGRPIDLLFFGSINERRRRIIERIEAAGRSVTLFDGPVYGPERDAYVRQARAVLNCHFYESARFEQVRAFQVLSLGTPLVSETSPDPDSCLGFEKSVSWFDDSTLEDFFSKSYAAGDFPARARAQLAAFRAAGPSPGYPAALQIVLRASRARGAKQQAAPDPQRWIHAGGGFEYRAGWLNLSAEAGDDADLPLDLGAPLALPLQADSPWRGPVSLRAGATELVLVDELPQAHTAERALLGNCLALLRPGGVLVVDQAVPARGDPQDSWLAFCGPEFWRLGAFEHRLQERERLWLDAGGEGCARERAVRRRIKLEKLATTLAERTLARTMSADFCGLACRAEAAPATEATAPSIPILEVICVAYRRYGPLKVLVQSWLNQTATNWRLRVIHDGADAQFERIMSEYRALAPDRISFHQTPERFNDYGHSLRELGLRGASGDYVLLTNDDNYYVPRFLEFVNEAISQGRPEVVMYDMVHSHDNPGLRPLPAYSFFPTQYSRGNIDMGAAIVRGDLAKLAGFRDHSHDGDATYFEDVARAAGKVTVAKIPRVLFVHN